MSSMAQAMVRSISGQPTPLLQLCPFQCLKDTARVQHNDIFAGGKNVGSLCDSSRA